MKIIHGARGAGKTAALIEHANAEDGYIIVRSRDEADRLHRLGAKRFPITFTEASNLRGMHPRMKLSVDGLEELLRYMTGFPITAGTLDVPGQIIHMVGPPPWPGPEMDE